jgi:hypothetical protein
MTPKPTVAVVTARLHDGADLDIVRDELACVVGAASEPAHLSV